MSNTGDPRGGRVWARMVSYIIRRDPTCKLKLDVCTGKSETADHMIPVEDGGTNVPNNLQGACHACNKKRGSKPLEGLQEAAGADLTALEPEAQLLLFDGSEKPSHRVLLEGMGVTKFSFSFWRAFRRGFPKTKPYLISETFADDAEVFVDSGWMQAQEKLEGFELDDYVEAYDTFLANNLWRLSGATEMHLDKRGMEWINQWRDRYGEHIGDSIWPIWVPEHGQLMLSTMARDFDNVALPNRALEDTVIQTRVGALARQHQTSFHALNVANPDTLRSVPLTTSSTISWASPQMRGETIVWAGNRLMRYQARMKQQSRSRYKNVVENAGLDYEKVLADDSKEVTRLAIWSYLQLEKSMTNKKNPFKVIEGGGNEKAATNRPKPPSDPFAVPEGGDVDNKGLETRHTELPTENQAPKRRDPGERMHLPVFDVEVKEEYETSADGKMTIRETPVLKSSGGSLRQCNSCVISANCPAFTPDAECAFSLPVELRTKEQLKGFLTSVVELQGQRIAFARFAEELNGGYPDPNLSQEIDRLYRIVNQVKKLEENHEFSRITVERQTSGGVLSSIFGERADVLKELDQPVQTDEVLPQIINPDS